MSVKLLTDHRLEFLSLKEGCKDSSESTLVKIPNCWKSRLLAQLYINEARIFIIFYAEFTKKYAPFELTVPDIYSVDNQIKDTYPGT